MQSDTPIAGDREAARRGYLVTSLADYLTCAQQRADELRRQLAMSNARRTHAEAAVASLARERERLGARWIEAQERAEALRRDAEDEASRIIREARSVVMNHQLEAGRST